MNKEILIKINNAFCSGLKFFFVIAFFGILALGWFWIQPKLNNKASLIKKIEEGNKELAEIEKKCMGIQEKIDSVRKARFGNAKDLTVKDYEILLEIARQNRLVYPEEIIFVFDKE